MGQCDDNDMELETFSDGVASKVSDDSGIEDMNDDAYNCNGSGGQCVENKDSVSVPQVTKDTTISTEVNESSNSNDDAEKVETACIYPLPFHQMPSVIVHQDVKDPNGIPGICGLQNLGNTCFINAGLQCMMSCIFPTAWGLQKESKREDHNSDVIDGLMDFQEKFQAVSTKMLSGHYSMICPSEFHSALARAHYIFGDHKQHDCQEFILFMLNALHEAYDGTLCQQGILLEESEIPRCDVFLEVKSQCNNEEDSKRMKIEKAELEEPDAGVECEEGLTESDRSWRAYTKHNNSPIVDTFHGQFKSIVTCGKCGHISVTHEPFVCMSLPIPYAMERQLVVTWLPAPKSDHSVAKTRARRFLVTVKEYGHVEDIRSSLLQSTGENMQMPPVDIILAEVRNSTVFRSLDDRMQVRYLDTKEAELYAIEVNPVVENGCEMSTNNELGKTVDKDDVRYSSEFEEAVSLGLRGELHEKEGNDPPNAVTKVSLRARLRETRDSLSDDESSSTLGELHMDASSCESADEQNVKANNGVIDAPAIVTITGWHSCSICLEDTFDSDLTIHAQCGGMLCNGCLEATSHYHGSQTFPCPVCRTILSATDYKPFAETSENTRTARNITVPLLCRHTSPSNQSDGGKKQFTTIGHPTILLVPSEVHSSLIYQKAEGFLLQFGELPDFKIAITDAQGQSCARCDPGSKCPGCILEKDAMIILRPGDHFAITLPHFPAELAQEMVLTVDDASMQKRRMTNVVQLDECFESFCASESLGEENTWYCPQCQIDQVATKVMATSRFPPVAIVHLKRFYFEGLQSRKVNTPVDFPLENLNLDRYSAVENDGKEDLMYELVSCVCHTGDLFTGHYTAYAKHKGSGKWYYFNDEQFTEKAPSSEDFEKAYVLFYQRTSRMRGERGDAVTQDKSWGQQQILVGANSHNSRP